MIGPCFTYLQLHNCSVEDLNKLVLEYSVKQAWDNLQGMQIPEEWFEKFLLVAKDELKIVIDTICTFEYYQVLRQLYDSQDRFDLMSRLFDIMWPMPKLMGEAMTRVMGKMDSPFPTTEVDEPSA